VYLAEFISGYLRAATSEAVGFVYNDEVPPGIENVICPLSVVLLYFSRAPSFSPLNRFDRIE
jgi:hypothetical protein